MVVSGKNKTTVFDILNVVCMCVVIILTLYPFIYLLTLSLSPVEDLIKTGLTLIPSKLTFYAYNYIMGYAGIANAYKNTIFITFFGVTLNIICTAMGAYSLSIKDLPGRKVFTILIIFTMMFSGGLIPFFLIVKALNLTNSLWSLIIPNCISAFWVIIARNFFQTIPQSLSESARIDGCSEFRILYRIVLPLSLPIISTLALFHAVGQWNIYFNAIIFNTDPKLKVLQVLVRSMYETSTEGYSSDSMPPPVETVRAATVIIATLPILCLYPFLQKYFVKGMMVGAVKG